MQSKTKRQIPQQGRQGDKPILCGFPQRHCGEQRSFTKQILILILMGWTALSKVANAEDFPTLEQVQHGLDYTELGLIQGDAPQKMLSFQRLRFFVLTNDLALRTDSLEFSHYFLPPFKEMVSKMSSGFGPLIQTLDYAEASLVKERAEVALDTFEKCRALVLTDRDVVNAENSSQFQRRMETLKRSVDGGQLRTAMETQNLSNSLLAHLRGGALERVHGGPLPWPLCTIWGGCPD